MSALPSRCFLFFCFSLVFPVRSIPPFFIISFSSFFFSVASLHVAQPIFFSIRTHDLASVKRRCLYLYLSIYAIFFTTSGNYKKRISTLERFEYFFHLYLCLVTHPTSYVFIMLYFPRAYPYQNRLILNLMHILFFFFLSGHQIFLQ